MNYHPSTEKVSNNPNLGFAISKASRQLHPCRVYTKDEYPSLPETMVKIISQDGRNIFLPASKFSEISTMDF